VVDERLAHREKAIEVHVLLGQADPRAGDERIGRLAEHEHLAVGDPDEVADRADQRGLAGAVGPEEAEETAGRDGEVEVLERDGAVVVSLCQAAELECRNHPAKGNDQVAPARAVSGSARGGGRRGGAVG
jgi:hypothetical protein